LPKSRASLALEIPSDITLDSYPGAYGQVLTNLIFNAVTHGFTDGPGGHMLIKARRLGMEQVEITFLGLTAAAFRRKFSVRSSIRSSPPDVRRAVPGSASTSSIIS
jgi:hypothetical protein